MSVHAAATSWLKHFILCGPAQKWHHLGPLVLAESLVFVRKDRVQSGHVPGTRPGSGPQWEVGISDQQLAAAVKV